MDLESGYAGISQQPSSLADRLADGKTHSQANRRASDRRTYSDRRRSGGLFDVRARRDTAGYDRRQGERREQARSWLRLWRRED